MKKYLFFFLIVSYQAVAGFTVDPVKSEIHFLSTKQSHITEVHKVTTFNGELSDSGEFSLKIDLSSVDTGIDIRNKRMREMLFDLSNHRYAELTGILSRKISDLANSDSVEFDATLLLNGESQKVDGNVHYTKGMNGAFTLSLTSPLIIQASKFNLAVGIDKLREIAGLKSISYAVPVTATLHLNDANAE